jgi:hypothetical protein
MLRKPSLRKLAGLVIAGVLGFQSVAAADNSPAASNSAGASLKVEVNAGYTFGPWVPVVEAGRALIRFETENTVMVTALSIVPDGAALAAPAASSAVLRIVA